MWKKHVEADTWWSTSHIFLYSHPLSKSSQQHQHLPPWRMMKKMMIAIHHRALLAATQTRLCQTLSCDNGLSIFYNAPLSRLLLPLLLHLVILYRALWIKTNHICSRNGNNVFNSGSRLSVAGKGNSSHQLHPFLSNSKLIRICHLLMPVIPLMPTHHEGLLFKSFLLEADLMQPLQLQLHLVLLLWVKRWSKKLQLWRNQCLIWEHSTNSTNREWAVGACGSPTFCPFCLIQL